MLSHGLLGIDAPLGVSCLAFFGGEASGDTGGVFFGHGLNNPETDEKFHHRSPAWGNGVDFSRV